MLPCLCNINRISFPSWIFFWVISILLHYIYTIWLSVQKCAVLTFPASSSFWASSTRQRTLAAMQRYLKKRWWDDQNCPHKDFLLSRPSSSAARMNTCSASAHWRTNVNGQLILSRMQLDKHRLILGSQLIFIWERDDAHQFGSFIVDKFEVTVQSDLFNPERHTWEAQLPGDVHPAHFHVHSDNLHGTNTSVYKQRINYST